MGDFTGKEASSCMTDNHKKRIRQLEGEEHRLTVENGKMADEIEKLRQQLAERSEEIERLWAVIDKHRSDYEGGLCGCNICEAGSS